MTASSSLHSRQKEREVLGDPGMVPPRLGNESSHAAGWARDQNEQKANVAAPRGAVNGNLPIEARSKEQCRTQQTHTYRAHRVQLLRERFNLFIFFTFIGVYMRATRPSDVIFLFFQFLV